LFEINKYKVKNAYLQPFCGQWR